MLFTDIGVVIWIQYNPDNGNSVDNRNEEKIAFNRISLYF